MKSRPKCLHDLGIARAASLASPPLSSSQSINHHLFRFETAANLAFKRSVEVMWHDENAFDAESSMPDSPFKSLKYSSTASIRGGPKSSIIIEHRRVTKKIEMALEIESKLLTKDKVKNVPYNGVQDITSQRHIFSSAGLSALSRSRMCASYAYALVEDGESNAMQGTSQVSRLFSGLNATTVIDKTYEKCIGLLDGKPIPSKHYDVIFNSDCQTSVFGVFSMMFSGKAAKDGINPMRDKVGSVITDSRLTIYDHPLNVDGFGYHLFDAEGSATEKSELIVDGCLQTLIHNSATASYFDTKTTGHGSRGPKSTLGVNLHQVEIAKGSDDLSALHSDEYLEVTDLSGLHSGANAISGNFSFGASGYLCKDGERIQAVRGITVAGNFYKMLNKISMIGNQQHWDEGRSALMPNIRFSDVAISG